MGIYSICIGKGIIMKISVLAKFLQDKGQEVDEDMMDMDIAERVEKYFEKKYSVIVLGHDAFESRHGHVTDESDGFECPEAAAQVQDDLDSEKKNNEYGIPRYPSLVFIGYHEDLAPPDGDLSYYVKTPELLYSLITFVPKIIKVYPILHEKDCRELEEMFGRKATMWTFASDCCFCCG